MTIQATALRRTAARRPPKLRDRLLYPFATRTRVLVVPGLHDSGPGHWQSIWQARHANLTRVHQDDFDSPDLERWSAGVARAIDAADSPPIIVAHSFGCLAVVHALTRWARGIAGALLVAPADPDHFGIDLRLLDRRLPMPTTLVGSTNDPWLKFTKAGALATRWGSRFYVVREAGHINAESGHGAWPDGLGLLRDVAERAAAAGTLRALPRRELSLPVPS
jgi:predicted alpha/beta hydrolase family esterase